MSLKQITLALLVALLMLSFSASTAIADQDNPDPPIPAWALAQGKTEYAYGCLHDDYYDDYYGFWEAGTYSTWITPEEKELLENGQAPGWIPFWAVMRGTYGKCVNPSASTEADFNVGSSLDIWYGACGMYFPETTFTGHASLAPLIVTEGVDALRAACTLSMADMNALLISNPMGLYYYYYRLDQFLYEKWEAGKLGLFIYSAASDTWTECSSYLLDVDLENGEYGRIACMASNLGPFVVGEK